MTEQRPPLGLLATTGLTIFLANAGMLVLQLLAGRYLAPFIGSSVETWTSIIGVFLGGIALGNWLGGKLADAAPSTKTLGVVLILGAVSSLTMMLGSKYCQSNAFHADFSLTARIPLLAAMFCILPATILSLITPIAIRLSLFDVRWAGRVAGLNFALSTFGCLIGNYLTGFWLMAEYSLDTISWTVAGMLLVLGLAQFFLRTPQPKSDTAETEIDEKTTGNQPLFRMSQAFAIVFLASFCGMSLELTASRVLAPELGVSLYTWTGIIGVMLAGTALGNYTGGLIADRGPIAGMRFGAHVLGAILGVCLAHPIWNGLDLPQTRAELVYISGFFGGLLLAQAMVQFADAFRWGTSINRFLIGGAIGATLAFTVAKQICRFLDKAGWFGEEQVWDQFQTWCMNLFATWPETRQMLVQPILIHGIGFVVGGILSWLLLSEDSAEDTAKKARFSGQRILSICFFAAALFAVLILVLLGLLQNASFMRERVTIIEKVLAWTFALFFAPMFLLGTISPQVIRLATKEMKYAGRTAGSVYAVSTLGAIVGTFAAGYFLIELLGMYRVLLVIALTLATLSVFVGKLWRGAPSQLFGVSLVLGGCMLGIITRPWTGKFDLETKYYSIRVSEDRTYPETRRTLTLDHLVHSYVDLTNPLFLGYKHEEMQGEFLKLAHANNGKSTKCLVIGGGGYTFPRWACEQVLDAQIDVVEIDPGVTKIAREKLALKDYPNLTSYHQDGRQFVMEKAQKGSYQLVMQDAVNDLSVPYHLMTKEYNDGIKKLLTKDGTYLLTLIDNLPDGKLWRAAAHTLRESFSHVSILSPDPIWNYPARSVYILYAADRPLDLDALQKLMIDQRRAAAMVIGAPVGLVWTNELPAADFDELLARQSKIILSDQYAPVDNLMSGIFAAQHKNR